MITALAMSILIGWGIFLLAGTANPRYAYISLPLCAPLAGACVAAYPRLSAAQKRWFLAWPIGVCIAFLCVQVGLTISFWKLGHYRPWFIAAVAMAMIAAGITLWASLRRRWIWTAALLIQALALSVPMAAQAESSKLKKTAFAAADVLHKALPSGERVLIGFVATDQPELPFYAGVKAWAVGETLPDPRTLEGGHWVLMKTTEKRDWDQLAGKRLSRITAFGRSREEYYLAWLAPKPTATTFPAAGE